MSQQIINRIQESVEVKQRLAADSGLILKIEEATRLMLSGLESGHRIYFCGNGGSAADAQHLSAELSGRFYKNRKALPAEALHCNSSYVTAVANDYSYDVIYQRLIEGFAEQGDVLVALSTSGNSKNIILAVEEANKKGMQTIGLTGEQGGIMKSICSCWIGVPSADTPRIQECHILIGHILCEMIEQKIFES